MFRPSLRPAPRALRPLLALSTFLLALSLLAGCYSYSQHVTLNKDGSGNIKTFVEHAQISFLGERKEVESRERAKCTETEIDLEKIPGVMLVSCEDWIENYKIYEEAIFSFSDVSVLSTGLMSYSWKKEGNTREFTLVYDSGGDPPTEQEKTDASKDMEGYRGVTFAVTLPGTIAEAPGAVVEGKTATWDYPWEKVIDEGLTLLEMKATIKLGFWERLFGK
jgi:hypothetical protein